MAECCYATTASVYRSTGVHAYINQVHADKYADVSSPRLCFAWKFNSE